MSKKPKPSQPLPTDSRTVRPQPHPHHLPINISFRYYEPDGAYCLSRANRDEIRRMMDCLRMLTTMTWDQVRSQGGRPGHKVGLAYTLYDDHSLGMPRPVNISPDLDIAGLRASGEMRIFGVNIANVFHVLWFDLRHDLVKG